MNCPGCKSQSCSKIECPAYLKALTIGLIALRFVLCAALVLLIIGKGVQAYQSHNTGSALDEFWARPMPEAPVISTFLDEYCINNFHKYPHNSPEMARDR